MFVLLGAHSGIRYLVLLTGLAALSYALYGVATRRPYDRIMARLGSLFAGTLHLQILVGIGLVFSGRFAPAVGPHIMTMLLAAAVAQIVPSVMRRRRPEARSYAPHVVNAAVALGLVVLGVLALGRPLLG